MANLPETETYDAGVYQLETTDAVVGGASGKSNAAAINLANRTKWLKARVDALLLLAVQATEAALGIAEIATQAETNAGTDDTRIVTPKKLMGNASFADGHWRLPDWMGGWIIKYGSSTITSVTGSVTFVPAFPTSCGFALTTDFSSAGGVFSQGVEGLTETGFTARTTAAGSDTFYWLAFGK